MENKTIRYAEALSEALKVLRGGGVILYPTDTIWGIGCDATDPEAVARVYEIKKRSDSKALVLLACDMDMVCRYVREIPDAAIQLVEVNDRPMTIIYPGAICGNPPAEGEKPLADRHFLAYNAVASDGTVGIRIPDMDFCRDLIFKLGRPIVSTSANISGAASPGKFADIPDEIKNAVDYIVKPPLEKDSTGLASQIIKVGLRGEIQIIRE
ncbi:MAG: L-threonylcarbamoyladenylate synthase [Candidatus Cryptobacteroides sp.]|nr:L-threonylcarbamoyladenylate synthase [Bacteroidales bacterium]